MENNITHNEIKKALYKEKPIAKMTDDGKTGIRGATAITGSIYMAKTSIGNVRFFVPHHEIDSDLLKLEMPAQLLIRWIDSLFSDVAKLS